MADIGLKAINESEWDLDITEDGDITLVESAPQQIKIILQWIYGEWRLGPDLGFPWFEDVWVKNPNLDLIRQDIISYAMSVQGVTECTVNILEFDTNERHMRLRFTCVVDEEKYTEEVNLYG